MSENLKWDEHILINNKSLVKQLGFRLTALSKLCNIANFKTRKMVADGLFMSKLVYLIPLWGGCESYLIRALQIVQNKAARCVTRRGKYTSTRNLLTECGWLSVNQLVFFHTVLLLFKVRKNKKPKCLFEMVVSAENERYGSRSGQIGTLKVAESKVPVQRLNFESFKWRSVRFWNQLPMELRVMEHQENFKNKLKSWVREHIDL